MLPSPPPPSRTPIGIVFRPAQDAAAAVGPIPSGLAVVCRDDHMAASSPCVLLIDSWPVVRKHLTGRRPRFGQAVGAVVDGVGWRAEDAKLLRLAVDFIVVRAADTGQRVDRTSLAEHLRNTHSATVLLWAPDITEDEADTLIAAGRIDGYLHGMTRMATCPHSAHQEGIRHG